MRLDYQIIIRCPSKTRKIEPSPWLETIYKVNLKASRK
jgi:hypothetical protein